MASAALPFFFPAIQVDDAWYGDGGIRLTAPLSPAIHLGAKKIIAVTTRYARTREEADRPMIAGYPPPAQVAGVLFNAIFLDQLDGDALQLRQINELIEMLPDEKRQGLRPIDLLVVRPSEDLGRLANAYEAELPKGFSFLTRGLGTRETRSNDMLSLVMFQPDYVKRLMDLGEADAEKRRADFERFLRRRGRTKSSYVVSYSPRSALIGSIRSVRSAGTTLAMNAVAIMTPAVDRERHDVERLHRVELRLDESSERPRRRCRRPRRRRAPASGPGRRRDPSTVRDSRRARRARRSRASAGRPNTRAVRRCR